MSTTFDLHAERRDQSGTSDVRRMRHAGQIPAVVYGAGGEAVSITLAQKELDRHMEQESFYSQILTLHLDGATEQVILRSVQYHPVRSNVLHMDLQRIRQDAAIHMTVPLHFIGEDTAPGVREQNGLVSHLLSDVEISCLPKDLPEYIEVDISELHIGELVHLSDIKLPDGVELIELQHGRDAGVIVINVRREIIEEDEVDEAAEGEEGEEGAAEGEGDGETKPDGESSDADS